MTHTKNTQIVIRRLDENDEEAVERLAQLDSGDHPQAPLMGVEVEGRLLVASSIATGKTVADPFSRTDDLRRLLSVRIAQLNGGEPRRGRFRRHGSRSRAALAGSPPGAGGRLLSLPVRLS